METSLDALKPLTQHRREEIHVEPKWVGAVTVSGAYWFQIGDAAADICWVHGDKVWFVIGPMDSVTNLSTRYGNCFFGPLPAPKKGVNHEQ